MRETLTKVNSFIRLHLTQSKKYVQEVDYHSTPRRFGVALGVSHQERILYIIKTATSCCEACRLRQKDGQRTHGQVLPVRPCLENPPEGLRREHGWHKWWTFYLPGRLLTLTRSQFEKHMLHKSWDKGNSS